MQLHVESLSHRYGDLRVLEDINLTVQEGEVVAIIGPSGCGKSTLLGMLGGLLEPSSGSVRIWGNVSEGCLNPLTYVFQDFALLPWRTVQDNVALALEHHATARKDLRARVADVLRRTGLEQFAQAYPKQLSGGMRQRVGIARALAVNPAILLMDEPLSALDAQTRDLLMEDFVGVWLRQGITAVYVTHNLDEAIRLADRLVVLSRRPGRIRRILSIDIAKDARTDAANAGALRKIYDEVWHLIRDEAKDADKELAHAH
ncbi:ABC transporter ATP-binding protein [Bradyrhizobium sp. CCBAU 11361]|uniref:ABC transporter ATP-binding protein n=1 Tax=Bradyrhizobium sp. CCBAU 11361 TaxID=1630812 RepID=UPI002304AD8B|nr:ABC transporter ATP-binding protein [Bradyrhizobium sp. CCBAU 11361]MDA9489918.1 nitrate ABC transporter ATP-binding protein [Bradyrhizobium sp. CCBAU 11361]